MKTILEKESIFRFLEETAKEHNIRVLQSIQELSYKEIKQKEKKQKMKQQKLITINHSEIQTRYKDLFSKKGIIFGIIGSNQTGKQTLALQLAKEWKKKNKKGKVIVFDPQYRFREKGVCDYSIDYLNIKDWAKILLKKDKKNGKYIFSDYLLVLNSYRTLLSGNTIPKEVMRLLKMQDKIGFNLIYGTHHPKLIFPELYDATSYFSLFHVDLIDKDDTKEYSKLVAPIHSISQYVRGLGGADSDKYKRMYPKFPHIVIEKN